MGRPIHPLYESGHRHGCGRGFGTAPTGHAILTELVLVMAAAVAAAALLRKFQVPPVVGFIVAGILIGPGGLGLIRDRHQVPAPRWRGRRYPAVVHGRHQAAPRRPVEAAQLGLWRRLDAGAAHRRHRLRGSGGWWPTRRRGGGVGRHGSGCSTALVLWSLERSGDIGTGPGRTMVSVLLFQDLAVVPIMLALPLLAGHAATVGEVAWRWADRSQSL